MKKIIRTLFFLLVVTQICFAQWVQTDTSLHSTRCLAAKGSYLYAEGGFYNFICVSTDNGDSWYSINPGFVFLAIASSITFSGENIIVGTNAERIGFGGVILSTDNGVTWSEFLDDKNITSVVSNENNVFAGNDPQGVFYSSDSGITWDEVNNGLTNRNIRKLAISGSKTFAGTGNGVFLTTNNGTSWTAVNNGLSSLHITALAVSGIYVFAGTGAGVFRTSDDGANWLAVNSGISGDEIVYINDFAVVGTNIFTTIEFNDTNNNHYSRVYLSTNFGEMWNDVSTGLPEEIVPIFSLTANEMYLFAGTLHLSPWAGVWRRPLSEIITDVDGNINYFPQDYNLSQNYPNPFNPSTTLRYSIPAQSKVMIKVFDILGNEIEILVNEEKQTGTYEITWYAEDLPSGVYFYRLQAVPIGRQAGDFVETKKMVLMK